MKKGFFKGVKTEFSKIVWPSKDDVAKETVAVVAVSAAVGAIIYVADIAFKTLIYVIS
ncbi:MAG: preprotein translocase subunit SecE [Lachnospiraceae bacterium]|nr:preprotein translocase subunit SecE [Lachnospiraceae bacterium]